MKTRKLSFIHNDDFKVHFDPCNHLYIMLRNGAPQECYVYQAITKLISGDTYLHDDSIVELFPCEARCNIHFQNRYFLFWNFYVPYFEFTGFETPHSVYVKFPKIIKDKLMKIRNKISITNKCRCGWLTEKNAPLEWCCHPDHNQILKEKYGN